MTHQKRSCIGSNKVQDHSCIPAYYVVRTVDQIMEVIRQGGIFVECSSCAERPDSAQHAAYADQYCNV